MTEYFAMDKKLQVRDEIRMKNRHLIFLAIIILQLAVLVIVCLNKAEYHIDEIYSYILSNSFHSDRISNDDSMWDQWVPGSQFESFITVQEGERFAYDRVYYNNSKDAHPPFYYWILHSVCSLFPDQFSKWFGLIINLILFVFVDILIYHTSRKLISSQWLQFIPVFVYSKNIQWLQCDLDICCFNDAGTLGFAFCLYL